MNLKLKFVPMGTVAPTKLDRNEIWLDVGSRDSDQIFDHHSDSIKGQSTTEIVFKKFEKNVSNYKDLSSIVCVLHNNPDLDAITSFWLVTKIFENNVFCNSNKSLGIIVKHVTENDQGLTKTKQPDSCWPIVMRLIIGSDLDKLSDEETVYEGSKFIDRTFELLTSGEEISHIAKQLLTNNVRFLISSATRSYLDDLKKAFRFQINLPLYDNLYEEQIIDNNPRGEAYKSTRWALADVIYFQDATSRLFKELARGDVENSFMGQGFAMLITSETKITGEYYRYRISTDPITGFHLDGLGNLLEKTEQKKESKSNAKLLDKGRERINEGDGRFGYNLYSPWYDGRGHRFTIIDSPNRISKYGEIVASVLNPTEVLDVIWDYGDPAYFCSVCEAEITLIYRIDLIEGWESEYPEPFNMSEISPDLRDEIKIVFDNFSTYGRSCDDYYLGDNLKLYRQEIWNVADYTSLWIGKFKFSKIDLNLKLVSDTVAELKSNFHTNWSSSKFKFIDLDEAIHICYCRVSPREFFIEDEVSASANIASLIAQGRESAFGNLPDDDELKGISRIYSKDRKGVSVLCDRGISVFSVRDIPFNQESDFQKPSTYQSLINLVIIQKYSLKEFMKSFSLDSNTKRNPFKLSKDILRNKWKLIYFEQEVIFSRISEKRFGQQSYEKMKELFAIDKLYENLINKIETLEKQINLTRSNFYQKILFFVTTIIAPISVTAALFSGTQMQKEFAKFHFTLLPAEWQPAGWLQFLIFSLIISIIVVIIWRLVKIEFDKNNIFEKRK